MSRIGGLESCKGKRRRKNTGVRGREWDIRRAWGNEGGWGEGCSCTREPIGRFVRWIEVKWASVGEAGIRRTGKVDLHTSRIRIRLGSGWEKQRQRKYIDQ
jgi:hypothetical protein